MKILSRITVALAAIGSLLVFTWPLFISASAPNQANLAQGLFIALMPLLLVLISVEFASGQIEIKQLAVLGVLIALNAVIRTLGAGTGGIETAFFIIIIGGFALGAGFGFILGAASLLVSALLAGGIGPWLPFQMMAAGLVGIGAAMLPRFKAHSARMLALIPYAVVAAFGYGALMTMWNWPFLAGSGGSLSYVAGAGVLDNLTRFLQYELVTGGLLWDLGRAITTCVLLALTAKALLATLERVASRTGVQKI
ncbi:MAG: ECF transporter S component [Microbacteriaceae bacterium]|nr:ECF transporter S component [Microbacteriaceae bacterium]